MIMKMPVYLFVMITMIIRLHVTSGASTYHHYCIIGAGPSGLQMGYFLQKSGRDYIIFERHSSPGWFYTKYPRHRQLISINKRHTGRQNKEFNLRHDWNSLLSDDDELLMKYYSKEFFPPADSMVKYLTDFAKKLKLKIQYDTDIDRVEKVEGQGAEEQLFRLFDFKKESYKCKYLIASTGLWKENVPDELNGVEHTIGYPEMSLNKDHYEGRTILILGKGNSAFETAQYLLPSANLVHMLSRNRVRFSWETHYVGDVRAVNCGSIDTYQLKSLDGQLEADLDQFTLRRRGDDKICISFGNSTEDQETSDNSPTRIGYDLVIRALGFKFDATIFDDNIRPKSSHAGDKYPEIKPNYEMTSSRNVFVTGTATHSLDHRFSAGGFIHGFRYTTRALWRYLEWRNHGVPWPNTKLRLHELLGHLLRRLNEASDIYQMFSVICDVVIFEANSEVKYFQGVPRGMLPDFESHTGHSFSRGIIVTLEYGKNFSGPGKDPFRENRATGNAHEAHTSNFLHPVLYYYSNKIPPLEGDLHLTLPRPSRIHHMVEDFLTDWTASLTHVLPLRWFLENVSGYDLRNWSAESCFKMAMTGLESPLSCEDRIMYSLSAD